MENALVHGLMESDTVNGEVAVCSARLEGRRALVVSDTGARFTPEAWARAIAPDGEAAETDSSEGYGLRNVERRLCIFFHRPRVLRLDASDPAHTRILIPLEE